MSSFTQSEINEHYACVKLNEIVHNSNTLHVLDIEYFYPNNFVKDIEINMGYMNYLKEKYLKKTELDYKGRKTRLSMKIGIELLVDIIEISEKGLLQLNKKFTKKDLYNYFDIECKYNGESCSDKYDTDTKLKAISSRYNKLTLKMFFDSKEFSEILNEEEQEQEQNEEEEQEQEALIDKKMKEIDDKFSEFGNDISEYVNYKCDNIQKKLENLENEVLDKLLKKLEQTEKALSDMISINKILVDKIKKQ